MSDREVRPGDFFLNTGVGFLWSHPPDKVDELGEEIQRGAELVQDLYDANRLEKPALLRQKLKQAFPAQGVMLYEEDRAIEVRWPLNPATGSSGLIRVTW